MEYFRNCGTFSQHTHFFMTLRNVKVYRKCAIARLSVLAQNHYIATVLNDS